MTALTMRDFRSNLATSFYSISLCLVLLYVCMLLVFSYAAIMVSKVGSEYCHEILRSVAV